MLARLYFLVNTEVDFAFETTLAARHFVKFMRKCKANSQIRQVHLSFVKIASKMFVLWTRYANALPPL